MSAVEETTATENSSRLTFRQKFWLFGVGLPVLLLIVLFARAVILSLQLNSTERKLLGRWEVVQPPEIAGRIVECHPGYADVGGYRFIMWCTDEKTLCVSWLDYDETSELWARFQALLGRSTDFAEILSLTDNELKIQYDPASSTIVMRRIEVTQPEL